MGKQGARPPGSNRTTTPAGAQQTTRHPGRRQAKGVERSRERSEEHPKGPHAQRRPTTQTTQSRRGDRRRGTVAAHRRHDPRHQSSTGQRRHHRLGQGDSPGLDNADAKCSEAREHRRASEKFQRQRDIVRVATRRTRHEQVLQRGTRQLAPRRRVRAPKTGAQISRREPRHTRTTNTANYTHNNTNASHNAPRRRSRKC